MVRRRILGVLLLLAALVACGWLVWSEIEASGILGAASRDGTETARAPLREEGPAGALDTDLREGARLRGLPGIRTARGGTGRLTGAVHRYLEGQGPRPLPGVLVRVVGVGDGEGRGRHGEVETREDGTFVFDALPALAGYAVVVDHPPFKEVVLRGLNVRRDRTTDVGMIVLGAPTALIGDVVDTAGRPVAGACVQVFFDRSRPRRLDLRQALVDLQAVTDALAQAQTTRDGAFGVADLPPGRYVLRVAASGYATVFREGVWVTADERAPSLHIVLDRGAGYHGRVVDEDGRGIGGARVIAVATMPDRRRQRVDRVETLSASDGRYRLDSLVSGVRYFLEAWAEGYAPAGRFVQPEEIEGLDLVLVPSGRVEGRITDAATGDGIAGAEVTVVAGTANSLSPVSTVTDGDGRYVLAYVSPGPIVLFAAKAPGYPVSSFDIRKAGSRKVEAGVVTVINETLEKGRVAFGRVTDEHGTPVPYATVAFADPRRRIEGEEVALTDVDGAYRVEGLRIASYEVRITAPGYAPLIEDEQARVDVSPDTWEMRRDFTLARGGVLSGTVYDPDGAPVRGARLEAVAQGGRSLRERVQDLVAVTASTGRWRIAGIPPHVSLVVCVEHDEWVRAESSPIRLAPGEAVTVDIALGAGLGMVGRVTDPQGRAIAGARVRWGPVRETDERMLGDEFRADRLLTARVVRTDGDGGFQLDHLPPGRVLLKVEKEGYASFYRKDVVLCAQGTRPRFDVELTPALQIEGTVRDARSRRPVAEAWVYAKEREPGEEEEGDPGRVQALVSAQTDADGGYVLKGLPPGHYDVVVWLALGYRAEVDDHRHPSVKREDVAAGTRGVDFALEPIDPEGR